MNIEVKVIGPSEKLKGLFLASGKADGKECTVLVRQQGENVALVVHSTEPSFIGKSMVISFSGNVISKGKAALGEVLEFTDVRANMRPSNTKSVLSSEEVIAKKEEQIEKLTVHVETLISMLNKKEEDTTKPK